MPCPTCLAIQALLNAGGLPEAEARSIAYSPIIKRADKRGRTAVKRKASAYSKRFGKAMKALKKKHPRTSFRVLVKKAHRQAKRGK